MREKKISILCIIALAILSGCQNTQPIDTTNNQNVVYTHHKRIAISATPSNMVPSSEIQNIAIERAMKKGYLISSRQGDLNTILNEQHIQYSNLTEKSNVSKIGNILNVDSILILETTNIDTFKNQDGTISIRDISMVGRLIDTQSGQVDWIKNAKSNSQGLLTGLVMLPLQLIAPKNSSLAEDAVDQIMNDLPLAGS